jgi:hypothetical protein
MSVVIQILITKPHSKVLRGYGIKFLENRCLKLKCSVKRGAFMKTGKFLEAIFVKSVFEKPIIIAVP